MGGGFSLRKSHIQRVILHRASDRAQDTITLSQLEGKFQCSIPDAHLRGITILQLARVYEYAREQCRADEWTRQPPSPKNASPRASGNPSFCNPVPQASPDAFASENSISHRRRSSVMSSSKTAPGARSPRSSQIMSPTNHRLSLQSSSTLLLPDRKKSSSTIFSGSLPGLSRTASVGGMSNDSASSSDCSSSSPNPRISPDKINLYDMVENVIKPITKERGCSYVEFTTDDPDFQLPRWFVSHFWGEHVQDFINCLGLFRGRRKLADGVPFWICAYALRQNALEVEISNGDPMEEPFAKALLHKDVDGTVMILDEKLQVYKRCWCCFEAALTIRHKKRLDLVVTRGFDDGTKKPFMITDRSDGYQEQLDQEFPLEVAVEGMWVTVELSVATRLEDKNRILNYLATETVSTEISPIFHRNYNFYNQEVRKKFGAIVLRVGTTQGDADNVRKALHRCPDAHLIWKDALGRNQLQVAEALLENEPDERGRKDVVDYLKSAFQKTTNDKKRRNRAHSISGGQPSAEALQPAQPSPPSPPSPPFNLARIPSGDAPKPEALGQLPAACAAKGRAGGAPNLEAIPGATSGRGHNWSSFSTVTTTTSVDAGVARTPAEEILDEQLIAMRLASPRHDVDAIVNMIKDPSRSIAAQAEACRGLGHLVLGQQHLQEQALAAGALDALLTILKLNSGQSPSVREEACRAMWSLVQSLPSGSDIGRAKEVNEVMNALLGEQLGAEGRSMKQEAHLVLKALKQQVSIGITPPVEEPRKPAEIITCLSSPQVPPAQSDNADAGDYDQLSNSVHSRTSQCDNASRHSCISEGSIVHGSLSMEMGRFSGRLSRHPLSPVEVE